MQCHRPGSIFQEERVDEEIEENNLYDFGKIGADVAIEVGHVQEQYFENISGARSCSVVAERSGNYGGGCLSMQKFIHHVEDGTF